MQRFHKLVVLLGLAAVVALATGADDGELKIGVVDLQQALMSTEEGKAAREEMERKAREAQGEIEPLLTRMEALQEEIKSKQFVLSEEAMRAKRLDWAELGNQIESRKAELEGRLKVDQERIVGPLRTKLIGIVRDVGQDQGFTLIVERGSPGLLYSREAIDITDIVIEKFNSQG